MATVAEFLSTMGTIVTAVFGWLGDCVDFIISNPVILVPMLMFFTVGGIIALVQRLMRG